MKISETDIIRTWIPSREEVDVWIKKISTPYVPKRLTSFSKQFKECYWRVYDKKIYMSHHQEDTRMKCKLCNADLILKKSRYGTDFYACPEWRPNGRGCPGTTKGTWITTAKWEPKQGGYLHEIAIEFKKITETYISTPETRMFMKVLGLEPMGKLFDDTAYANTKDVYHNIRERAEGQESTIFTDIKTRFPMEKIMHGQWLAYELKNGYIGMVQPDIIIITEKKLFYIEVKNSFYDFNREQIDNHLVVIKHVWRDIKIVPLGISCTPLSQEGYNDYLTGNWTLHWALREFTDINLFSFDTSDPIRGYERFNDFMMREIHE